MEGRTPRAAGGAAANRRWRPTPTVKSYEELDDALPACARVEVAGQRVHLERAGRGEPVVLLHGFGCSSYAWRGVTAALARRYEVVAPDLNGFGWTERPRDGEAYTLQGQESLVWGLLDELGIDRAHLVGHSYGGGLAIWMAWRRPERVRTLTLVAAALPEYSVQQRQSWARFRGLNGVLLRFFVLRRGAVRRALRASVCDPAVVTDEMVEAYRRRLLVEGLDDAFHGLMAPSDTQVPKVDLADLDLPVLAVWGDSDGLIPFTLAEPYLLRLPRRRIVVLERCGHAPMEERPAELAAHLLDFLGRHRARWTGRLAWRLSALGRRAAALIG